MLLKNVCLQPFFAKLSICLVRHKTAVEHAVLAWHHHPMPVFGAIGAYISQPGSGFHRPTYRDKFIGKVSITIR